MSFYDTQTYCGIVDIKVVVGICNKINFTKVWISPRYRNLGGLLKDFNIKSQLEFLIRITVLVSHV